MAKKENPNFPKNILSQIEEFANGGYVLFTFSPEGSPITLSLFETEKDELALNSSIEIYNNSVQYKKYPEEEDDEE